MVEMITGVVLCLLCKQKGGWVASLKGGAMTLTETIALLMLIAYVVYLVVYISRNKD